MLEMRDERGTDFHEKRLQLLVARAGNQRLVHRVKHRLVIGDFVIDVGLVERRALQSLERGKVASPPALRLRLVGLSSGVTFSFVTRATADLLTPVWR